MNTTLNSQRSPWFGGAVLAALFLASEPSAVALPCHCALSPTWETVDVFQKVAGRDALLRGIATRGKRVYAVGNAGDGTQGYWIVRRSKDNGKTWKTVDEVAKGQARGVATDPRNGHVYAVGFVRPDPTSDDGSWVVRGSADGGDTWTTVDNVVPTAPDPPVIVNRIAVDGSGNISVVGYKGTSSGPHSGVLRRSADGGATWTTIDFAGPMVFSNTVLATKDGQVFVGGTSEVAGGGGALKWMVRHSLDGVTGWTTVDDFGLVPAPTATSGVNHGAISRDGKIVFVGSARESGSDTFHWIAREAQVVSPTVWTTVDDFRPVDFTLGFGDALPSAATYGREGTSFVTGRQLIPGETIQSTLTREGKPPATLFLNSDLVTDSVAIAGQPEGPVAGAATTRRGDILIGVHHLDGSGSHWLVRRKACR